MRVCLIRWHPRPAAFDRNTEDESKYGNSSEKNLLDNVKEFFVGKQPV